MDDLEIAKLHKLIIYLKGLPVGIRESTYGMTIMSHVENLEKILKYLRAVNESANTK